MHIRPCYRARICLNRASVEFQHRRLKNTLGLGSEMLTLRILATTSSIAGRGKPTDLRIGKRYGERWDGNSEVVPENRTGC